MFKTLFFTSLVLLALPSGAAVEMRWLTVASVLIDDGETRILFDPAYTRPSWKHWLNLEKFRSDEKVVRRVLRDISVRSIDAIFVSHSHHDHSVDAATVARLSKATFYVDESTERIARAHKEPNIWTKRIQDGQRIKIGKFIVIPVETAHAQILGILDYLPGKVREDFDFGLYDYRMGSTWSYVIHHPDGVILVAQGAKAHLETVRKYTARVDALIQTVANRESDEEIFSGYLKDMGPRIFVPNHFDNFFTEFRPEEETFLPGVKLEGLLKEVKKKYPQVEIKRPVYNRPLKLL